MGQSVYRAGVVLEGNYKGKSVYLNDDSSFIIVSNDENGKIIIKSLFPTRYEILKTISKGTVDRYQEVSATTRGADPSAVATGAFWLGAAGALIGAAASQSATIDVAIYFKNGEKSLIRFTSADAYQKLKAMLFTF